MLESKFDKIKTLKCEYAVPQNYCETIFDAFK